MNKETNDKILELLKEYLDKNPNLRFCQALINTEILGYEPMKPNMCVRYPKDAFYTTNKEVITALQRVLSKGR